MPVIENRSTQCVACGNFTDYEEPVRDMDHPRYTFEITCATVDCGAKIACTWEEDFDDDLEMEEKFTNRPPEWR